MRDQKDEPLGSPLYTSARKAPWWMVCLLLHLALGLVLSLVETTRVEEDTPHVDATARFVGAAHLVEGFGETEDPTSFAARRRGENPPLQPLGAFQGRPNHLRGEQRDWRSVTEGVMLKGLRWLKAHQSPLGQWEAKGFRTWCDGKKAPSGARPAGAGDEAYDTGVTGLALCAFLGAGYTSRGRHGFRKTVVRGLRYLRNVQDSEGCFGDRRSPRFLYNHGAAALALIEAYGMTDSTRYRLHAQRALNFIARARNPRRGWRSGVRPGDNDTSVTAWLAVPIHSARLINTAAVKRGRAAPLALDEGAYAGITAWVETMTDSESGRVGYRTRGGRPDRPRHMVDRFQAAKSESMTAAGVLARIFMGENPRAVATLTKGVDLILERPPTWNAGDGSIDMYYWYYGALAMYQMGGKYWDTWKKRLEESVTQTQRTDTTYCAYRGSWDPIGPWGEAGGRVYSTALMTMCLQLWNRYDRVFGSK